MFTAQMGRGKIQWGAFTVCVFITAGPSTGTREEPGTLTQGAPVFPGSSRLGIEPKTPGWLVQDPNHQADRGSDR